MAASISVAVAVLVCMPSLGTQPERASVVYYAPGVMSRVVVYRQRHGLHIRKDVDGYAARPSCEGLGSVFWLSVGGKRVRLQQVDCSHPRDRWRHERVNQVEVSWEIALRLGVVRAGRVRGWLWRE